MRVLEGRAWVKGQGLTNCCIGWEDERIVKVAKVLKGDEEHHTLRHDRLILPGAIDLHVHFREPGATHKEDFGTGTAGAACGGVTTILDMPNNTPFIDTLPRFSDKLEQVSAKAHVDFGLYGMGRPDTIEQRHFSTFDQTVSGWKVYPYGFTSGQYRQAVSNLIERGSRIVVIHAEHPEKLGSGERVRRLEDHTEHRLGAEFSALELLAGQDSDKLHVAHLSSRHSLALMYPGPAQKANSVDTQEHSETEVQDQVKEPKPWQATSEVTPHHLLLAAKMESLGLYGKCDPPLQRRSDNAALWESLRTGHIDCVASDHAPHTHEEKETDKPMSGMPGVETMVPLMLQAVRDRLWELPRAVEALCEAPARRLGLEDLKGALTSGHHADIMVVDVKNPVKIKAEELHSRCGWTPFEGWPGCFPEMVWCRGELVSEDREIVGKRGFGKYLNEYWDR